MCNVCKYELYVDEYTRTYVGIRHTSQVFYIPVARRFSSLYRKTYDEGRRRKILENRKRKQHTLEIF